jgi:hypothetical protein
MKTVTSYPPLHCGRPMQPVGKPVKIGPESIPAQWFECRSCHFNDLTYTFLCAPSVPPLHILLSGVKELIAATGNSPVGQP